MYHCLTGRQHIFTSLISPSIPFAMMRLSGLLSTPHLDSILAQQRDMAMEEKPEGESGGYKKFYCIHVMFSCKNEVRESAINSRVLEVIADKTSGLAKG